MYKQAAGAMRNVLFGGGIGNNYSPKCMRIAAGQMVTFTGSFMIHPIAPGAAPSRTMDPPGSTGNPITMMNMGTTATVTFPAAGTYPYFCSTHESLGMFGVIQVQ